MIMLKTKISAIILATLLSTSSYALTMENAINLETSSFTDEMAQSLGMTESSKALISQINKDLNATENGIYDLRDDEANSRMSKVVVIINEDDRDELLNPEGQSAKLYIDGRLEGIFDVSTGSRRTKVTSSGRKYTAYTPHGFFRPKKAYQQYYSYTFFGSNMKYAVFFKGGIATHRTGAVAKLGTRDSGGCIRLTEENARKINQSIVETGEPHRNTASERICKNGTCLNRTMYTNREKYNDLNRTTGEEVLKQIWSYDATIIVKPGGRA
jgi:hypothetical protein